MPFGWTVNPFRGCEIGCRYCYARPTHEYLGHLDPADFEERIYVKRADLRRLARDLARARDSGQEVAIGTATDPYQPAEARFRITRAVLETIARVPGLRVGLTTKAALVTRDLDVLTAIAGRCDLWVNISLMSMDDELVRLVEPRAPRPDLRLAAMQRLAEGGIRTRLFAMPVLPALGDSPPALRELLTAARQAGAREAISQLLFLRTATVRDMFLDLVRREFPWALSRYLELYSRPGYAPADARAAVDRLFQEIAREVGLGARTREERVKDEAPPRARQLSLVW